MRHAPDNDARVEHLYHGEGTIRTISPCGQYATVRYPAGYVRTHRLSTLTRVTPPASTEADQ